MRSTVRASGYVALLGVLLFGIVGLWQVTADKGPRGPYASDVVPAGTVVDTEKVNGTIIWGGGSGLVPDEVTCTVTRREGGTAELDLTSTEPRATAAVLRPRSAETPPGEMTVLAEIPHLPGTDLTCSGGGLETFALGSFAQAHRPGS
ncbi:hypothetical protein NKG05_16505 [Oerskovia sp. M15]